MQRNFENAAKSWVFQSSCAHQTIPTFVSVSLPPEILAPATTPSNNDVDDCIASWICCRCTEPSMCFKCVCAKDLHDGYSIILAPPEDIIFCRRLASSEVDCNNYRFVYLS